MAERPDSAACCHPRELALEDELSIAEGARADGDWKHALHHYVSALGIDAFSQQALTAIRRLHAEHGLLEMLEADPFAGAQLARGYLLADEGKHDEAVSLFAQVDEVMPELGAVQLLSQWISHAGGSEDARGWAVRRLVGATQVGMGRLRLLPGERAAIEPYADLAAELLEDEKRPPVLGAISGIFRRAQRYDDAILAAHRGFELSGSVGALIPLALAKRAAGKPGEAAELFGKVHAQSQDPVHLLERARALGDAGRHRDAIADVRKSLEASGNEPDGEVALFVEWLESVASGDPVAARRDYDWVRRKAIHQGTIAEMSDAGSNALADPNAGRWKAVRVTASSLESPSVRLCIAVHAGAGPDPRAVEYSFGNVPSPDPRLPRGRVTTLLWAEVDGVMVQAVPRPSQEIRDLVAAVAIDTDDLFSGWDRASELAARAAGRLDEIAHAMVFPTDPAEGWAVPAWVYRYQVAAACLIARSSDGWRGTERRRILLDLVRGPMDWTTAAVVLVLGEIAVREADALPEIRRELMALAKAIPQGGHCSFGTTLALTAQKIPFFRPELAEKLAKDWLQADDQEEGAPPSPPPPEETTKRPWWKFW